MTRLFKKIFYNEYLFSVVSKGTGVLLGILFSVFFNRYLGTDLRGEAAIIANYVSLVSVVMGIGLHQAYPYFKKKEGDIYQSFINNMVTLFVIYLALGIGIAVLTELPANMKVAALMIPLAVVIKQLNYVVLMEHPRRRHVVAIIMNVIDLVIIVTMMLTTRAAYVYLVIFLLLKEVIYLIVAFQNLHLSIFKVRLQVKGLGRYMRYGLLPMVTMILMTINYRVDILMLQGRVGVGQIGVYALGVGFVDKLWIIPDTLRDILTSRLARGKKESEVAAVMRYSLFISLILMVMLVIFGRSVIVFLYGQDFHDAYYITIIMLMGIIAMIFYKMTYAYNVVNGHKAVNFSFLGMAAVTNLIGNYLFIPYYGIYAAAGSSVVSYTLCGMLFLTYFHRKSGIPYRQLLFVSPMEMKEIYHKVRKAVGRKVELPE